MKKNVYDVKMAEVIEANRRIRARLEAAETIMKAQRKKIMQFGTVEEGYKEITQMLTAMIKLMTAENEIKISRKKLNEIIRAKVRIETELEKDFIILKVNRN